ncbi:uncharacterized protein LOC144255848 [Urocitellus parryii]
MLCPPISLSLPENSMSFQQRQHLCLYVVLRIKPGPHPCQGSLSHIPSPADLQSFNNDNGAACHSDFDSAPTWLKLEAVPEALTNHSLRLLSWIRSPGLCAMLKLKTSHRENAENPESQEMCGDRRKMSASGMRVAEHTIA